MNIQHPPPYLGRSPSLPMTTARHKEGSLHGTLPHTDVCVKIFVRRLDPKDPGADRGRAVGPRSRAIADTFVVATCAAFVPVSVARSSVATSSPARDELIDLAEGSSEGFNPGFWDPLGCSGMSFLTLDNDQAVGDLRHAEIKHGRVAMAAFLGYCVQCLGVVGEHTFLARTAATSRMWRRRSSGTTSR